MNGKENTKKWQVDVNVLLRTNGNAGNSYAYHINFYHERERLSVAANSVA